MLKRIKFKTVKIKGVFWFSKFQTKDNVYRWRKISMNKAEDPEKLCNDCYVSPDSWVWVKVR